MPAGVSSNTTIQAQTKVIEKAYLSETDRVPAQYKTIIPDLTSDERRRFVTYLPYAGLSAFQEKIEGALLLDVQRKDAPDIFRELHQRLETF